MLGGFRPAMSNLSFELQMELTPILRSGDIARCERTLVARLASLPLSPFHIILDLSITTDAKTVALWFDEFFQQHIARFQIGAAYTEMNAFFINPDLWFCNAFAYEQYGGHDDYDWLSRWQSEDSDICVIEGFEPLQNVYANGTPDKRFWDSSTIADLLVIIKFQDLIRRAVPHMRQLRFPLLATAHDYDFIYEIRPDA